MDDLLKDFLTESLENLARLDTEIVELERSPNDHELLKSIFRAVHTIKGTCGFLDLSRLETVAHAAENVLGRLRDGELAVSPEIISDVLSAIDTIKEILHGLEQTAEEPAGDDTTLCARLDRWMPGSATEAADLSDLVFLVPPSGLSADLADPVLVASVKPGPTMVGSTSPAAESADRAEGKSTIAEGSLRVGVGILDLLMNLAGELVLTRNQLLQLARDDEESPFRLPLQHLNLVTSELQEAVMKTRMQPIGNAWQKLPRLVRDLCQSSGKQIHLEMIGADTELDRQILQAIGDPLTHMVRNSADHGIESPEVRRAAGKPERGTVTLDAFHEGGHIVIEIRDDGRGLSVETIRDKAVERGLVKPELAAGLTDSQVYRFIFEPGFSTAQRVTNVSGRGVGMDVVRSNIEGIGGTIDLSSVHGQGTTIRVKIPLTLAILSALIVGSGGVSFAVPQIGVVELVRVTDENRGLLEEVTGSHFFRLREQLLPLVRLADIFRLPIREDDSSIVVCQVGGYQFGLVVDEIYDTQEIVVKPLGRLVKEVRYYSGTTILGDGRVIMILDVPGVSSITLAGVTAEEAAERSGASGEDEVESVEDLISFVVFSSGTTARQAVPLSLVSRLEKVPSETIELADGRYLVQYRGSLLPLVPASEHVDMRAPGERPVIVFSDGTRSMGLAVEEIHDILDDRLEIQTESVAPGIIGAAVIGGRSTEVIDIQYFLRLADPAWFRFTRASGCRQRVLLVDDSRFFLNVVGPVLRTSCFEVVTTGDGAEALDRLERGEAFDLIITDIDMPQIDGWELSRRLRDHPEWRRIPLLALTGRSIEGDRERARELGFHDFLQKFDRTAVLTAVHAALRDPEEAHA
jgi:two-component system, chemotaxis family, sensor kinase CheA